MCVGASVHCMNVSMCVNDCVYVYLRMCVGASVHCMNVSMCVNDCVYVYLCVWVHLCTV